MTEAPSRQSVLPGLDGVGRGGGVLVRPDCYTERLHPGHVTRAYSGAASSSAARVLRVGTSLNLWPFIRSSTRRQAGVRTRPAGME
jgi:hypothetical protein